MNMLSQKSDDACGLVVIMRAIAVALALFLVAPGCVSRNAAVPSNGSLGDGVSMQGDAGPGLLGQPSALEADTQAVPVDWSSLFKRPPMPEERSVLEKKIMRWTDSKSATELLAKGRMELALGRIRDGEGSLRESLRLQPSNEEAWLELAGVYARTREAGKLFEVLGEINEAIALKSEINPTVMLRYRFLLANGYFMTGRGGDARNILSDMISKHVDFTPAYVALADSYLREGKDSVAEFVVKRAIDRGKDDPSLENLLGAIALGRKDNKAAASHFGRAIEMAPTFVQALVNRANLSISDNDLSAAEEDLNRAIAIDPANTDALVCRGIVLRRTGRADLARASFERVLETDPVNAAARFNLGVLNALDLNRPDVALRLFEEVVSMNQASPSIRARAESYIADLRSLL